MNNLMNNFRQYRSTVEKIPGGGIHFIYTKSIGVLGDIIGTNA
jgi:hypothetical protein